MMMMLFQTDKEIFEELNKYPGCVPLKMVAAQRHFDEQMASKQA
jgi:hypothetical protein